MTENDKLNNAKKIEDGDLGKVSGGGILSSHSLEEFEAAGVEVIGCSRWFSMT